MKALAWPILALLLSIQVRSEDDAPIVNTYDPELGVFIGELPNEADGDVSGKVYVVNETTLQILNFTYNGKAPDLYFWLDESEKLTSQGVKIPTFEFGITPLGPYDNAERVVLNLPTDRLLSSYKSFGLFCYRYEHNFGTLHFPENLQFPHPQFLPAELKGARYNINSGPIVVMDRRTVKIFGFGFEGDKAPDAYFFVGRGPNVGHSAGVKVPILGRDTPERITSITERYRGGLDIMLLLPEEYDIEHIDWLSIYCYKFEIDFAHITVSNISSRIPPYVPPQKRFGEMDNTKVEKWPSTSLLGTDNRLNFTFQLGPPGGKKGYKALTKMRPAKNVWYVNGYLADVYLRRGLTYTFIVEGGSDKATNDFYNPLYVSDDPFGGYARMMEEERKGVKIYAGEDPSETAGRTCIWTAEDDVNPDSFATFAEFKKTLTLKCDDKDPATLTFTPEKNTPDTLYFNSYSTYNMGYKLHIVDEMPDNLPDWQEEPYDWEHYKERAQQERLSASAALFFSPALLLVLLF